LSNDGRNPGYIWLSASLDPDELIGILWPRHRAIGNNTFGQDALSNIGLPGTAVDFTLDELPTYGDCGLPSLLDAGVAK
jgi:hypothetical protein